MKTTKTQITVRIVALVGLVALILASPLFTNFPPRALAGSANDRPATTTSKEQSQTETNQSKLITTQPAPSLDQSAERANLIERLKLLNTQNLTGYIYLMGENGQVVANYVTNGKASSLNAYLTADSKLTKGDGTPCSYLSESCFETEMPDLDGTYGKNADGIFFFTSDGAYVEWYGPYLWSNQPLKINTPVTLTREVK